MLDSTVYVPLHPEQKEKLAALASETGCSPEAFALSLLSQALEDSEKPLNPLISTSICPDDTIAAVRDALAVIAAAAVSKAPWARAGSGVQYVLGLVDDALDYEARVCRPWIGKSDGAELDVQEAQS